MSKSKHFAKASSGLPIVDPPTILKSKSKCIICLEIPLKPCTINCGNHHIFCQSCISQWSKVKLRCPYCKSPYTSYTAFDSQQSVLFDEPVATGEEDDGDYEEGQVDGVDEDESEDLIRGYESDEGFIVNDDAVEYDSDVEERTDLQFKEGTMLLESSDEDEFVDSDESESDLDDASDRQRSRSEKSKKKRRRDEKKGEKSQRSRRVLDDDDDEEEEQEEAGPTIVGKDQIDNDVETKDNAPNSSKDYASFFDQFAYKE